ncbi:MULTISPECIES: hypothetical protein [unclassified Lysinibacillus]|uniref:hypothetical protein n=1 Tax=unclassified Lysinibacillus TaxID=2636778 RepID=UPI00382C8C06
MNVFDIVKSKVKPDVFTDEELLVKIEEVAQSIKTYCNRSDIPEDLKFVHANMALDLISHEIKAMNPADYAIAKSIKEGDVAVEFGSNITIGEQSTVLILANYTLQLNRFRKLRW